MLRSSLVLTIVLAALPFADAQEKPRPVPDHGRVLACALDVFPHKLKDTTNLADTTNYVFRGKVISLGKDKKVSICYDVEHMRVAGAWVGKPVTWSADKNMGPTVEGEMVFATKPGPGWADPRAAPDSKRDPWADPRVGKEGPLPHDWCHYKGLYLHGDKVILSYSVGNANVLETVTAQESGDQAMVTRWLEFEPTMKELRMVICEETDPFSHEIRTFGKKKKARTAKLESDKWRVGVTVEGVNTSTPIDLEVVNKRLHLIIPPMPKGDKIRIDLFRYPNKTSPRNRAFFVPFSADVLMFMLKGGPGRWTKTFETVGILGDDKIGPYTLDQIQLPETNPWNASIRLSGLDFFDDGRAALCTWDGDVWIVSGLDAGLEKVRWKRFAAGLQQPLGLKIINGIIHVAGRDQITKLHDLNGDGEADFYENLNNDAGLTLQRHEFVMDLQTDRDGNLYYCRSGHYHQSKRGDNCVVYKLSPDGKKLEKFARGFREPNGLSISPDGTMTVADNEGNGIPQTPIYRLLQGKDYGFTPSLSGKVNDGAWKLREQPIVWLGPKVDMSAGSQAWVPLAGRASDDPSWGPLAGELLHTSYGNCALFHVLIDKTAEPWQGAVWKFPLTFNSGIMRARFNPKDGQLYVCGLRGWGTNGVKDGQFARIRSTGKDVPIPLAYRVTHAGLEFTFSSPLDKASTEDDGNWAGTWTAALKKTPSPKELQEMPITSVRLGADRKTVTIALEKTRTVPNFALQYRIKSAAGSAVRGELNGTIHRVP